jgi:heterodisulfide reductase subunit B
MAKVAYYPGCALEGSGGPYDRSTRALVKTLGLDMETLNDWNCCGAMEVKNVHPMLQTYMSARNMAIASEQMGYDTVMAPCNGCYHNLKKAEYELATSDSSLKTVQDLAKKSDDPVYDSGKVRTIHLLEWLMEELGPEGIKQKVSKSLKGIKIANYYGCMYTRPRQIFPEKDNGPGSESSYKPHYMDDLLAAAGAENVDFPLKTACCGGAHTLSDADTSTQLVLNLLQAAEDSGAEVIATECPTCHSGLEMHQVRAETEFGIKTNVKILYFTQLLGLAMGLSARKVGIHENVSDSLDFLQQKGVI